MAGPAVREALYLLDEAFNGRGIEESNESQALMTNLATVGEREWRALPAGAAHDELGRAATDALDPRGDDRTRLLPRRRNQSSPQPARYRRSLALAAAGRRARDVLKRSLERTGHNNETCWPVRLKR